MKCSPFFTEEPSILVREWDDFFPFHEKARRCTSVALNSFTRFGILLGLVLAVMRMDIRYLVVILFFPLISVAFFYGMQGSHVLREGFQDQKLVGGSDVVGKVIADVIGQTDRSLPSAANPFMNVLMNEFGDNPKKGSASNSQDLSIKKELDTYFQTSVYSDPGDVYNRNQSQRQFVVPPNSSIPNDRHSLQNWLYRVPGKTCREGNTKSCPAGTEGGRFPHLT